MKSVYVNEIVEMSTNVTYGMAVINKTIEEDLQIIFEPKIAIAILHMAKDHSHEGGVNLFTKFCQYVVLVCIQIVPVFDGSINFIDCHNDVDAALDEYLSYTKNNWLPQQKAEFMKQFQEIQNNPPKELAQMIIKDAVNDLTSYL